MKLILLAIVLSMLVGCLGTSSVKHIEPNSEAEFDPKIAYLIVAVNSEDYLVNNVIACRGQTGFSCSGIFLPAGAKHGVYVVQFPISEKPTRFTAIEFSSGWSNMISANANRPAMLIDKPGIYYFGAINVKTRADKPNMDERLTSLLTRRRHIGHVYINHRPETEVIETAKRKYESIFKVYKLIL